jgi:tetratricopeptide (TPR) repeat protein
MLLATVLLSAALAPAAPPPVAAAPQDPPANPEAMLTPEETPEPPMGLEGFDDSTGPAPTVPEEPIPPAGLEASAIPEEPLPAAPSAAVQGHIDAGLKAFVRGRFSSARAEFEKAYEAAPESAATAFYLGYACYKLGEPSLRMNDDKQRARELFAKAYRLDPAFQPVWGQKAPPAPAEE